MEGALLLNLLGYLFVFLYELFNDRAVGLEGGPGAPYIKRETINKIRSKLFR